METRARRLRPARRPSLRSRPPSRVSRKKVWLALTSSHLYHKGSAGRDDAEERLWYHCRLSLYSFAVQKVFSIVLFVYLINSDSVMRGLHDITLEQHSAVRTLKPGDVAEAGNDERRADAPPPPAGRFLKSAECAICFHDFCVGDTARASPRARGRAAWGALRRGRSSNALCPSLLSSAQVRFLECDHGFHKSCVDPWLTRHQNRCPICNGAVGPVTLDDEARGAAPHNRRRD